MALYMTVLFVSLCCDLLDQPFVITIGLRPPFTKSGIDKGCEGSPFLHYMPGSDCVVILIYDINDDFSRTRPSTKLKFQSVGSN